LVKALIFPEIKCWTVLIEENELTIGDTVLIKGSTTGEQILKIEKMMVNDTAQQKKPLLAIRARFNSHSEFDYPINYTAF
jgi:hypothetical protein